MVHAPRPVTLESQTINVRRQGETLTALRKLDVLGFTGAGELA